MTSQKHFIEHKRLKMYCDIIIKKLSRKAKQLQHVNHTLSFIFSVYNIDVDSKKVVFVNYSISTFGPHLSENQCTVICILKTPDGSSLTVTSLDHVI